MVTNEEAKHIIETEYCCKDCPCTGFPDCEVDHCRTYQALKCATGVLAKIDELEFTLARILDILENYSD